jgi:hypothetical protein
MVPVGGLGLAPNEDHGSIFLFRKVEHASVLRLLARHGTADELQELLFRAACPDCIAQADFAVAEKADLSCASDQGNERMEVSVCVRARAPAQPCPPEPHFQIAVGRQANSVARATKVVAHGRDKAQRSCMARHAPRLVWGRRKRKAERVGTPHWHNSKPTLAISGPKT